MSSILLPTIALQTINSCECCDLERQKLPYQSGAVAPFSSALSLPVPRLGASKEVETPQREELGVTLPQEEGFILFEGDN